MRRTTLEKFRGLSVDVEYKPIIDKYARKTKTTLMGTSPKSGRPNRKTPYYAGWDVKQEYLSSGYRDIVWNKTNWQLTHLLENGHFITNQGALSWSAPRKHIKPAFDSVKDKYIKAMKKAKIKADFK